MDIVLALAEALPTGLYTGGGLERYVRDVLSEAGRSDDFRDLDVELYLTGTDLDSCERVVFGADGLEDVPISRAVAASCAVPMVYKPVEIKDRVYVDGGLVSTTNIDIAIDAGAKFVVVVNPLVPYVGDVGRVRAPRARRVSKMGFPQIGYQAFKLVAHQRLHELARSWEDRYPGVDIILIEPDPNDELMFQTGVMNFTSRVEIARHGFESVTLHLAEDYPRFKQICAQTRDRDLGGARAQDRPSLRGRARVDAGVAQDPRADDRDAAAPVGRSVARRQRARDSGVARSEPARAQRPRGHRPAAAVPAGWRRRSGAAGKSCSQALATWLCSCCATAGSRMLERKRVLSIRPLKMGTPNSTHLVMTSRLSRPASRASSVGVR